MTNPANLAAAHAALRNLPEPTLHIGDMVYILPSEYGSDTHGMGGLEVAEVTTVFGGGEYEVDSETHGDLCVHAQRLRLAA